jgi:integrase
VLEVEMPKINIETVYVVKSKGREYHYAFRGKGAPRLHQKPGSSAYIAELQKIQDATMATNKGTILALSRDYRASDAFKGLSQSTKISWSRWLNFIERDLGDIKIAQFENPRIREVVMRWRDGWKSSPRSADYAVQVLSRIVSYACEQGSLKQNPLPEIKRLYRSKGVRSDIIWEQKHLDAIQQVASVEVFNALTLATLTGFRQGDLLALKWSDIKDNEIAFATGKSRGTLIAKVPLYDELIAFLQTIPKRSDTILTTTKGASWGVGFGSSFNKAKKAAGVDLHFHDARGTLATRLSIAGLDNKDIAFVMGWKAAHVDRILQRYVSGNAQSTKIAAKLNAHRQTTE